MPILERVARRLIDAGADRLVVNVRHLATQIEAYVRSRDGFGVEAVFSREDPGAAGDGRRRCSTAARLFRGDAPFFLHNADILTDLPLREMYAAHLAAGDPLATLAVMERDDLAPASSSTTAGLLGRTDETKGIRPARARPPSGEVRGDSPSRGVHVLSPRIFGLLTERGAFSILDPYLRLAAAGERILPFRVDGHSWIDIGRPEQLEEARRRFA